MIMVAMVTVMTTVGAMYRMSAAPVVARSIWSVFFHRKIPSGHPRSPSVHTAVRAPAGGISAATATGPLADTVPTVSPTTASA